MMTKLLLLCLLFWDAVVAPRAQYDHAGGCDACIEDCELGDADACAEQCDDVCEVL